MMLEVVERRFGDYRTPHPVEMLSDNGSCYIARETRIFARQLGLRPCYTPVKSPESNGIAEAVVKTLKRDYVHVTPLPDAVTVLGLIAGWIEDYNDNHAHSWLKMRSPREFIAAQTSASRAGRRVGESLQLFDYTRFSRTASSPESGSAVLTFTRSNAKIEFTLRSLAAAVSSA